MRRSSRWILLLTLSTLLALVAPASASIHAAPAGRQATAPTAPQAFSSAEIVLIESTGRIRVDSRYPNPVTRWTSGSDVGWQNIAAGNFDGNALGYQQIVAVRGSEIQVFEPFPTPTVIMHMTAPNGWLFDLLAVGDFDGDGLKEIAASYYEPGGVNTNIAIYHYVPNNPTWTYRILAGSPSGARWQDMQTGNINGDTNQGRPIDDLLLVRQPGHLLKAFLGTVTPGAFTELPDNTQSGFPYLAMAVGKIHTDGGVADEIVTSRSVPLGATQTVLLWRLSGTQLIDITSLSTQYNPPFTSISLADVNGDGHKELLMLRDPLANNTALKILDLANLADPGFEAAIGCSVGCTVGAWSTVRGGDIDADGMDETVVLRSDQYRIYDDAAHGYAQAGAVGGSFFINTATPNATSLLVTNLDGGGGSIAPVLLADPSVIDLGKVAFGQQSPVQALNITNGGVGNAINWTAQVKALSSAWLHIDRTLGTTPSAIRVWVDPVAAGLGVHTGDILISTSDPNVPIAVPDVQVKVTVTDPGFLVTPASVAFYQVKVVPPSVPPTRSVQIIKPSSGIVNWTAGALPAAAAQEMLAKLADGSATMTNQGISINGQIMAAPAWLSLNPTQGQVGGSTTGTITISVDPAQVANTPGVYRAVIVVRADPSLPNHLQEVVVTYILTDIAHRGYLPLAAK